MADFDREVVAILGAKACYLVREGKGSPEVPIAAHGAAQVKNACREDQDRFRQGQLIRSGKDNIATGIYTCIQAGITLYLYFITGYRIYNNS